MKCPALSTNCLALLLACDHPELARVSVVGLVWSDRELPSLAMEWTMWTLVVWRLAECSVGTREIPGSGIDSCRRRLVVRWHRAAARANLRPWNRQI